MNENIVEGKWREIKGEVQKTWGKLTDDELEKTKGDIKAIGGLIQQKYGEVEQDYKQKLSKIFHNYEDDSKESTRMGKEQMLNEGGGPSGKFNQ